MDRATLVGWAMLSAFAGLITSCGGGNDSPPPNPPAEPSPPPPPTVANSKGVIALYSAAGSLEYATTVPLRSVPGGRAPSAWVDGGCEGGEGSLEVALDGAPTASGTSLPPGSHTYSVRFNNCLVDGLDGIHLTGTTTLRYTTTNWSNVSADAGTASMRAIGRVANGLDDVTATGSGRRTVVSTITTSGSSFASSFSPNAGATLVNNHTTNVITFKGGSSVASSDLGIGVARNGFANLAIALNGVDYVLDGALETIFVNGRGNTTGEIRVTRADVLVGRIFVESGSLRFVELAPIGPF